MKQSSPVDALLVVIMLALAPPAFAAKPKPAQPVDNSPVVTPDTTPPPSGTAAPTGTVQMSSPGSAPAPYAIPIGGAHAALPTSAEAAAPPGPPEPAVTARAELCLRANVDRVAQAEPSAKLAIDLLLSDVCAEEVDAASQYVRNLDALARFNPVSERGRAGLSTARVDPETGRIVALPNVDVSTAMEAAAQGPLLAAGPLRKYAAELVLAQRALSTAPPLRPAVLMKKSH